MLSSIAAEGNEAERDDRELIATRTRPLENGSAKAAAAKKEKGNRLKKNYAATGIRPSGRAGGVTICITCTSSKKLMRPAVFRTINFLVSGRETASLVSISGWASRLLVFSSLHSILYAA